MTTRQQFDTARERRIYRYVEQNGAVEPETVRRNVLIRPETGSKPARSGPELEESIPMPAAEFERHRSALENAGYIEERDGKLRVAMGMGTEKRTVPVGDSEATVRLARQEDIGEIVDVIETIATGDIHVVARRLADELSRNGVLLRHNEREDRVFFVGTVEGETVGWLHVGGVQFPEMSHTAELTLGVLEPYRGDGLGAALMERGLAWAREQGYRKLSQNLPATNERAVSFLEDHGWSVEATREGQYLIDGELVDEVQLAIWLDE